MHRRHVIAVSLATAFCPLAEPASSQDYPSRDYPSRNVRVVVPYAPGGGTDFVGRVIAESMAALTNQSFIVENKPGAAGVIGIKEVAAATPDGYTVLVMDNTLAIMPTLNPKAGVTPSMLAPVALLGVFPTVLVANRSLPVNSVGELVDYARKNPSALNFGSGGVGTGPHLQGELLKIRTGIDMKHVAYRGAAAAQQDILGGSIQLMFTAAPTALSFINGGELKVLAATGAARLPILPAVPTMIEAGIKDYVSEQWFGLLAPAKTPEPILQRLYALATKAITDPAVAKRMTEQGGYLRPGSSEDFSRFMQAEVQSWGEIVRLAKLAAE